MGLTVAITNALGWIQGLVSKMLDNKAAAKEATARLDQAKQRGEQAVTMSRREWEAIGKRAEGNGWKDEYVTIIISLPFVSTFIGSVLSVATGNPAYALAANEANNAIKALMPNYPLILEMVVGAAVSIQLIKRGTR